MVSKQALFALTLAGVLALSAVGSAGAIPSETTTAVQIDSCRTIDQPGTYELTEDIEDSTRDRCIVIEADDVTFDGNGHAIDGVGDDNTIGVYIGETSETLVNDLEVSHWDEGILATAPGSSGGDYAFVEDVEAHHNKDGVKARDFFEFGLEDVEAHHNSDDGIHLKQLTEGYMRDVHSHDNAEDGVYFDDVGDGGVDNSVIEDNGDDGIDHQASGNIYIERTTIEDNADDGILFRDSSLADSDVVDSTIRDNGDDGVDVKTSTDISIRDNTICDNDDVQIVVRESSSDISTRDNDLTC
ncbi:right-handed parallel beta-helix repeat-containing protein [Haloarchaeobius baliensis]|uniref:right-handed parallel beta-helix repeat-containing protein n=1 Tax=Haloarchaeobius baliensis TaxID=1670458 RepID=UPI003F883AC5